MTAIEMQRAKAIQPSLVVNRGQPENKALPSYIIDIPNYEGFENNCLPLSIILVSFDIHNKFEFQILSRKLWDMWLLEVLISGSQY